MAFSVAEDRSDVIHAGVEDADDGGEIGFGAKDGTSAVEDVIVVGLR